MSGTSSTGTTKRWTSTLQLDVASATGPNVVPGTAASTGALDLNASGVTSTQGC